MPTHASHVLATPWPGVHVTRIESARHFRRHFHDGFGFGILERGAHVSASGRGVVRGYAGEIITTNPGEVHDGRPLGAPTRRWRIVSLDVAAMATAASTSGAHAEIARPVIADPLLARSVRRLLRLTGRWNALGAGATATDVMACEEALVEACTLLMTRHGTAPRERETRGGVAAVRERLADDPLAAHDFSELAAAAGLSRFQLLRHFARAYGLPPHAWLLARRAERARELIQRGASLAAAAAAAGFADQSHMTRTFALHYGLTPGAWQRAVGAHKACTAVQDRIGASK